MRLLQQKRSAKHTTVAEEQDALATEQVGSRNFLSFVLLNRQGTDLHDEKMATARETANAPRAPISEKTDVSRKNVPLPEAGSFHDLTAMTDTQLQTLARALKMDQGAVFEIREQQHALKSIGAFENAAASDTAPQTSQQSEIDAASFKDLTRFDDAQLTIAAKAMKVPFDTMLDIRAQQAVLKQLGMFGAQEPA